jgi:hypothetical protein
MQGVFSFLDCKHLDCTFTSPHLHENVFIFFVNCFAENKWIGHKCKYLILLDWTFFYFQTIQASIQETFNLVFFLSIILKEKIRIPKESTIQQKLKKKMFQTRFVWACSWTLLESASYRPRPLAPISSRIQHLETFANVFIRFNTCYSVLYLFIFLECNVS